MTCKEEYENERIKEIRELLNETPYQRAVSLKLLLLRLSKQRSSN
jgi:hypothetical protein